nr:sugar diacid recognition domain-containing protein [Anaerotalea alkaliphila]
MKKEECQSIIGRLSHIVNFDINIMDLEGMVVASTDGQRISEIHRGALHCIKNEQQLVIDQENIESYPGCKEGINIPLYNNDALIGVLGVSGMAEKVTDIAFILKELVEHIVLENRNQQFKVLQQEALRSFFVELFNAGYRTDYDVLLNRAKLLEFDHESSRVLILGQIVHWEEHQDGVSHEVMKKRVLNTIRHHIDVDDVSLLLYEEFFVIIIKWRANMESYLERMIHAIRERLQVDVRMVVGGRCDHISDYGKRYHAAKRVSDLSRTLALPMGVHFAHRYELELLLGSLSDGAMGEYLEKYGDIFKSYHEDKNTSELIEIIKTYFECNMNIGETAQALYVHRNTVGYRLNKFKEQFKVNINKPFDCMKIYLAIKMLDQKMSRDGEVE